MRICIPASLSAGKKPATTSGSLAKNSSKSAQKSVLKALDADPDDIYATDEDNNIYASDEDNKIIDLAEEEEEEEGEDVEIRSLPLDITWTNT